MFNKSIAYFLLALGLSLPAMASRMQVAIGRCLQNPMQFCASEHAESSAEVPVKISPKLSFAPNAFVYDDYRKLLLKVSKLNNSDMASDLELWPFNLVLHYAAEVQRTNATITVLKIYDTLPGEICASDSTSWGCLHVLR